ncbi:MAG: thermonuclease family protein, partial [Vampirovibrionia bacterium]
IFILVRINELRNNPPYPINVYVKRVVDGDTFVDVQKRRYRLIGIDTPELKHGKTQEEPFAKEATEFTKKLIEHKYVKLKYSTTKVDKYKRFLVYVYTPDNQLVNELLLEVGLAEIYKKSSHKLKEEFIQFENKAKKDHKGMWATE